VFLSGIVKELNEPFDGLRALQMATIATKKIYSVYLRGEIDGRWSAIMDTK